MAPPPSRSRTEPRAPLETLVAEHVGWLEAAHYASSTVRARRRNLRHFAAWCSERGIGHPANGDPVNFSDPFGLNPIGKIVKLGVRGFKKLMGRVPEDALVRNAREFEDVTAPTRQAASRIARQAGDGRTPVHHNAHRSAGEGARPHYHPAGSPSHVFYSFASALTVSHYIGENASGVVKFGAGVLDFFNPLGIIKDAIDITRDVKDIVQPN